MHRPARVLPVFLILAASVAAGCGERPEDAVRRGDDSGAAVADSLLIEVLASLHMADAERYLTAREEERLAGMSTANGLDALGQGQRQADAAAVDSMLRARGTAVDSVLGAHGVHRSQYDAAIGWYVDHPDQFVNLYNRILDRLNQVD